MKILSLIYRLAVIASLIISIYWAWSFFKNPNEFPIKSVKVVSRFEHVDEAQLKNIIAPFVMRGFFNVSSNELRQQLLQLPWIAAVSIERIWPNKLSIQITEQQAVAKWGSDKLLNTEGKIFAPTSNTFPAHLPILIASDDQQELLWQYFLECKQLLHPLGLDINLLELNARGALHMVLNNGIEVELGRTDLAPRLQRLVAVYPKLMADKQGRVEYIDLRYNNGLAVK
jgi:cell division protein FtsQ